ncbi:ferrous iron transport protein B [Luminiphilus syltensis NOR5-1B]|uniref:Ferrous iron transport protein B n=1 Tax=Luminiphilus syltensis NOR5-1B TaxID=565045 RepID=B8KS11_9GAMM|nr:ferrous iron transporter B [Luminiphilus syltensis]EED36512.1 ferrous iron transport protein B [Luminiphilus syltensis NOR5-1B]
MNKVLLVGSPNSGKSSLFNRLTGLSQKVANFPGITVDVTSGSLLALPDVELVDFPGTYSLQAISAEEEVAVEYFRRALADPEVRHVLCVVDATRLEKSLYFTLQVIRDAQHHGKLITVLANMADIIDRNNLTLDADALAAEIGAPVLMVSAKSGSGIESIIDRLRDALVREEVSGGRWSETPDALLRGTAHQLAHQHGPRGDVLIQSQTRLDRFFLSGFTGGVAFFGIMLLLFQSIFTWSAPVMDAVEALVGAVGSVVVPLIENTVIADFVADALFGGIGAFLVFVPQIFVLTFIIGLLEDSGYLARAALICHRPLRLFGMTGKSFIPMLSGVACAIPAIYAARSVDSQRQRLMTYLAIPLMPCSARLPVYALLIATFIPDETMFGGLLGWQGVAMFSIYFLGMLMGLIVTGITHRISRVVADDLPFVLELPPYRLPGLLPILRNAEKRCRHFVTKAGKVILSVTIVVWILGYFPNYGADLATSWLGTIGHFIEPVFEPIGLDWRYGVAIISSFLAREVFVGTLGTIFGIEDAEDNMAPLVDQIQASGLPIGSGVALLVFFAIALQCVSTLAILSRETRSWKIPLRMAAAYLVLAYMSALGVFYLVEWLV